MRSGCGCHHSSCTQSLNARVVARPSSGSEHCEYTRPQKPVIIDGKLSDAHTPLRSMSCTRASMSQQPGRIWSKRNGSTCTVSGRRPDDRVHAHLGVALRRRTPTPRGPSSFTTMRGARSCSCDGQPALEHVGRLHEVVVDRDDRGEHLAGSGSGRNSSGSSAVIAARSSGRAAASGRCGRLGISPSSNR